MAGVPRLNSDLSVTVTNMDMQVVHIIPPYALTRGGIGFLYERLVGLHYEAKGYNVEYRNRLGYFDAGVDLIANKEKERRFIQCKFRTKSISQSEVERLLLAASTFVKNNLAPRGNHFDLAIPFEFMAFPLPRSTKKSRPTSNLARSAFLKYNAIQSQIQLHIVEIPMEIPDMLTVNLPTDIEPGAP